jgi:hypothetical protein
MKQKKMKWEQETLGPSLSVLISQITPILDQENHILATLFSLHDHKLQGQPEQSMVSRSRRRSSHTVRCLKRNSLHTYTVLQERITAHHKEHAPKERGTPRTQLFLTWGLEVLVDHFPFVRDTHALFFQCCDHQMRLCCTKQTPRRMSLQLELLHFYTNAQGIRQWNLILELEML